MKLRTFVNLWHRFNDEHFDGTMLPPKFRRTRSNNYWACYENDPQERQGTIYVNYKKHWQMEAIFFHEMVHQYVEEVLGIDEDNHHSEVFWKTYYERAPYGLTIAESF
jgi:hypothetical protein